MSSKFRSPFFFYCCLCVMLAAPYNLIGQDFDNYQVLRPVGEIPQDLRTSSSEKYYQDLEEIESKGKTKKVKQKFFLQSNFLLDELLLSGRVLFNDPVTTYVNEVKDKLLDSSPDLQKKVRVYVVRSSVANAFATDGGILLLNLGLLARLNNEAELAFILAHEIQHYLKKHTLDIYVKTDAMKNERRALGIRTQGDFLMAKNKYSRGIEQEADDLGFELYKRSGYSLSAAEGVFDVLRAAQSPIYEVPWDVSYFESKYVRFPASYSKMQLDSLWQGEDGADSLSTHPNIAKRRQSLQTKISKEDADNGEQFLLSPMEFLKTRKISRFEMCELYLESYDYESAFYHTYLLQQEDPESRYLRRSVAKSLYGMVAFRNSSTIAVQHLFPSDFQGERQQVQYFWSKLHPSELFVVAIRYCWESYLLTSEDYFKEITTELVKNFKKEYEGQAGSIKKEIPKKIPEVLTQNKNHRKEQLALIERQIYEFPNDSLGSELDGRLYYAWSLVDLFKNAEFKTIWETPSDSAKIELTFREKRKGSKKAERIKKRGGRNLGIDKVVYIQPIFKKADLRKNRRKIDFLASESKLARFRAQLENCANIQGLEVSFLESQNLAANKIDEFNDAVLATNIFNDIMNHSELGVDLLPCNASDRLRLVEKYGTKHFVWTGVVSAVVPKPPQVKSMHAVTFIIMPYLAPLWIFLAVKPMHRTFLLTYVIDMEKGVLEEEYIRVMHNKSKKHLLNSQIYDVSGKIKNKPKKP